VSEGSSYIWVSTVFSVANNLFCSSKFSEGLRSHFLELYFYDIDLCANKKKLQEIFLIFYELNHYLHQYYALCGQCHKLNTHSGDHVCCPYVLTQELPDRFW